MEHQDTSDTPAMFSDGGEFGDYTIERVINETDSWISYRALDAAKNLVTIKAARGKDGLSGELEDNHPIFRELLLLQLLRNPAIPALHKIHTGDDGSIFLVEEHVEGETLAERVRRTGPMTEAQALAVMWEISETLVYLQNQKPQVIHRNLNPDIILLTGNRDDFAPDAIPKEQLTGRVKITDFSSGILKPERGNPPSPYKRAFGYTPHDDAPSLAFDIYSFGAVLFFLVTGRSPAEFSGMVPVPKRIRADLSEPFSRFIQDCTQELVEDRIANAKELRRRLIALEAIMTEEGKPVRVHYHDEPGEENYDEEETDPFTELFRSINMRLERISGFHLFMILVITSIVFFMLRGAAVSNLNECTYNLKDLGADMERYAADHGGLYPETVQQLIPDYRKKMPVCPGVQADTYSHSYEVSMDRKVFTISCRGRNHPLAVWHPDYPRFSSKDGFIPDLGRK